MDNKITKSRISNFIAYEWIMLLVIAVASIVIWELVYTVSAVRLTVGQQFKYYYDYTVYAKSVGTLNGEIYEEAFSYDVLKVDVENLMRDNDVLSIRLSVQEGDAIFTDTVVNEQDVLDGKYPSNQANKRLDANKMYDYDRLVLDAKTYLSKFLKDDYLNPDNTAKDIEQTLDYANFDESKIEAHFLKRLGKDNRFRSDAEKANGKKLEKERIADLVDDVKYLQDYLKKDDDLKNTLSPEEYEAQTLFYSYNRYEQAVMTSSNVDKAKEDYKNIYDETAEPLRYGLKMDKFSGDKKVSDYMQLSSSTDATANGIVLLIFDFKSYQPDLQYETIGFAAEIIRNFSAKAAE